MTAMSRVLADDEATKVERPAARNDQVFADSTEFVEPTREGKYKLKEIACFNDFVVIAQLAPQKQSAGGILLVETAVKSSSTAELGIVVGAVDETIKGQTVVFLPKSSVADFTGRYPAYGDCKLVVIKQMNIIAQHEPRDVELT